MLPVVTAAAFGASSALVDVRPSRQRCYAVPRDRLVSGGSLLRCDRQPDSVGPLGAPRGCPADGGCPRRRFDPASPCSCPPSGTLVERTTRFTMLLHLPPMPGHGEGQRVKNGPALAGHGAQAVRDAIAASITTLPKQFRKSLTWDQGTEMAQHAQLRRPSQGGESVNFRGRHDLGLMEPIGHRRVSW